MPQIDIPINVDSSTQYVIIPGHRLRGYPDKSRWLISLKEEANCFAESHSKNWLLESVGWGLIVDDDAKLKILGENPQREKTKIAKFQTQNQNLWHGYPADLKRKPKDIPVVDILKKWRQAGIIEKHHMSKLQRGVACSL